MHTITTQQKKEILGYIVIFNGRTHARINLRTRKGIKFKEKILQLAIYFKTLENIQFIEEILTEFGIKHYSYKDARRTRKTEDTYQIQIRDNESLINLIKICSPMLRKVHSRFDEFVYFSRLTIDKKYNDLENFEIDLNFFNKSRKDSK